RGFQCFARNRRTQGDEVRYQVNIRFQGRKKVGFEHKSLQIQPLEGIFLDNLYDRSREELANVAKPFCDARRGGAETTLTLFRAGVVQRRERGVQAAVRFGQSIMFVIDAQGELPASPALGLSDHAGSPMPRIL